MYIANFSFSRHINLHQFCSICNIWVYKNKHKHCSTNFSATAASVHTTSIPSLSTESFIRITKGISEDENIMFYVPISIPRSALGLESILKKITKDQECQTDESSIKELRSGFAAVPLVSSLPMGFDNYDDDTGIPVELSQPLQDDFLSTPEQILDKIRGFWINSEDYYTCDRIRFDCVYDIVMFPPSSNHEEMKNEVYKLWNEECMNSLQQYDRSREFNCFI